MSKGQVFTADIIASLTIFSSFLVLFGILWNVAIDDFETSPNVRNAEGSHTFSMLTSEGAPPDWNSTNIENIGLYSNGEFDRKKFLNADNLTDGQLRKVLRSQGYKLEASYLNGTVLTEKGENLTISTSKLPKNRTVSTYNALTIDNKTGKRIKLSFYRWKE